MKNENLKSRIRAIMSRDRVCGPLGIFNRQDRYKGKRLFVLFINGSPVKCFEKLRDAKESAQWILERSFLHTDIDIVLFEAK